LPAGFVPQDSLPSHPPVRSVYIFAFKGRIKLLNVEGVLEVVTVKLVLWLGRFQKGVFDLFPTVGDFLAESDVGLSLQK
jgi:hypothetical protein